MRFEKRDILLIVAVFFLMVGMMAFLAPLYALIIAVLAYFGVRVFVGRRKRQIQREVGEGFCAVCGAKITAKECPNCNSKQKS